jgi:histidine ammonia-lyase
LTTEMNAATDNPMVFTGSAFPPLSTPLRIVMRVAGGLGV